MYRIQFGKLNNYATILTIAYLLAIAKTATIKRTHSPFSHIRPADGAAAIT